MTVDTPFDFFEKHEYDLGFCEWYKDPISCLVSYFVPCVAVGNTTGKVEGSGSFNLWSCFCWPIGAYRNRRNIQQKYNIKETEDGSMCAVGLCYCCAITQDMHEVNKAEKAKTKTEQPAAVAAPTTASEQAGPAPKKAEEKKEEEKKEEKAKKEDEAEESPESR